MTSQLPVLPAPDRCFHVSSGAVAFGARHNIAHGASVPVVDTNVVAQREPAPRNGGGTVRCAQLDCNVRARTGEWQCFALVDAAQSVAWFCCHSDWVPEAEEECRRILDHAGSPYEPDSGDSFNTDRTRAAGVFVINRYDWSWTDTRGLADGAEPQEGIGLADYRAAGGGSSSVWEASAEGAMLPCEGEYEFGRFSYSTQTGESYAFLYFRASTVFTKTSFRGKSPLRVELTHAERYAQRLAKHHDGGFSGFHTLQSRLDKHTLQPSPLPPQRWAEKLLGPFRREADGEHVLDIIDLDAMRRVVTELQFEPTLLDETLGLMDELWMAWLAGHAMETMADMLQPNRPLVEGQEEERNPNGSAPEPVQLEQATNAVQQPVDAGARLFPKHANATMSLDKLAYDAMESTCRDPRESAWRTALSERIHEFMARRGITLADAPNADAVSTLPSAQKLCAALEAISRELLELGSNYARDSHREFLCPCDLRLPVAMFDAEMEDAFGRAHALWVVS